ncbi:IS3 family transposase [Halobacillus naozhouensis]|uniref:IS3 family transposase n=1 Tax=Halobacillus naozhouensis TaxID=554880 RepID=UPI00362D0270
MALFYYVHWYNQIRLNGTLGYLSPVEYKKKHVNKIVWVFVDIPIMSSYSLEEIAAHFFERLDCLHIG